MKKYYELKDYALYVMDKATLETIINYFEPNEELEEEHEAWVKAKENGSLESVQDFINEYVNVVDGIEYHKYRIERW